MLAMVICTSNPKAGKTVMWNSQGFVNFLVCELQTSERLCIKVGTWPSWDESSGLQKHALRAQTHMWIHESIYISALEVNRKKGFLRRHKLNKHLCKSSRKECKTGEKTFVLVIYPLDMSTLACWILAIVSVSGWMADTLVSDIWRSEFIEEDKQHTKNSTNNYSTDMTGGWWEESMKVPVTTWHKERITTMPLEYEKCHLKPSLKKEDNNLTMEERRVFRIHNLSAWMNSVNQG